MRPTCWLPRFLYSYSSEPSLGNSVSHNGLGLLMSTNSQGNLPQTCPSANLIWTIHQQELSWWVILSGGGLNLMSTYISVACSPDTLLPTRPYHPRFPPPPHSPFKFEYLEEWSMVKSFPNSIILWFITSLDLNHSWFGVRYSALAL